MAEDSFLRFFVYFLNFLMIYSFTFKGVGSVKCHCTVCPDDAYSDTCELKPGGQCYTEIEQDVDSNIWWAYGCLSPVDEEGGMIFQCKNSLVPHQQPRGIGCCATHDLCNLKLHPILSSGTTAPMPASLLSSEYRVPIIVVVIVFVILISFLVIVFVYHIRYRSREGQRLKNSEETDMCESFLAQGNSLKELIDESLSSGCGSGLPLLAQQTIAKQISLVRSIGRGRYGEVWKGKWRDENVAVKIFFTSEEASWYRETEIYQTAMLRHDNILGFIAADMKGTGSWTQLLFITDYHEYGSLYDFLQQHYLDVNSMLKMAHSIVSGVTHLHTEIHGTQGKPAIAHRDIKSRNVLVKKNGTCCVADLGLAVRLITGTTVVDVAKNTRQGTKRYMAPEVLDGTLVRNHFEAFKQSDIYSLALVLWELARRCNVSGMVEDYQVPFHDAVGQDPSFDEMKKVVCVEGRRPEIPKRWLCDENMLTVTRLIQECWVKSPTARLTSLRVKKTIGKMRANLQNGMTKSTYEMAT